MDPNNSEYNVMPKSQIKKASFWSKLSGVFGFQRPTKKSDVVDLVKVDTGNDNKFDMQKALGVVKGKLSGRLDALFENWLTDTAEFGFQNAKQIHKIFDDLMFACTNDPFIFRRVNLVADEATNPDTLSGQIISVETPDKRASIRIYQLLKQWNITQDIIRSTIWNIDLLGNAYWLLKVTPNGIERVKPFSVKLVKERLEFNPIQVAEQMAMKQGDLFRLSTKSIAVGKMLDELESQQSNEFIDMFDTRHFGYVLNDDLVVPPWTITHFRLNADQSDFAPYGMPDLIFALAPFRQAQATMTLQSIARLLSFPVTMYKIKTVPGQDEASQFEMVERARTAYENIGVVPVGNGETYSVNTKIWMPDGLMEVDVKSVDSNIDFVKDLEMYQDRVAVASAIPKGYLVQEWGGFGNSAISLVEQFKPFARLVYTRQSAFLDGLAEAIRLHFALTGEFDYSMPFTLSMRFPAEEMSDEKRDARSSSLDLANDIMDMVKTAVGVGEDEDLPPEVIQDIVAKYTFLNDVDITKWTSLTNVGSLASSKKDKKDGKKSKSGGSHSSHSSGGSSSSLDFGDLGDDEDEDIDFGDEDIGFGDEDTGDEDETDTESSDKEDKKDEKEESTQRIILKRKRLLKEARIREITKKYTEAKDDIYFKVLRENGIDEFVRTGGHIKAYCEPTSAQKAMIEAAKIDLDKTTIQSNRLKEVTLTDMMDHMKEQKKNGEI